MGIAFQKITALWLGWFADRLFGDPQGFPHLIVAFGKSIELFKNRLNKGKRRFFKGLTVSILLIIGTYFTTFLLLHFAKNNTIIYTIISALFVFYCLSGTTLIKEVRETFAACEYGIENGRKQVSRIVGRDVNNLSLKEIKLAALETLSENLSDGVIAPLFWLAVLGLPGMAAYKMVNTLDSMIGYRNIEYKEFGCAAARIDDFANFIPSRLTGFMMLLVSGKISEIRNMFKQGKCHLSPNSGYPEAALAIILNCRFGGPHFYFGECVVKPYIGTTEREINPEDVEKAINVNKKVEIIGMILCSLSFLL